MLRLIFWILIAANAALFAYHQGVFGTNAQGKREPERLQSQLNADQIRLLSLDAAKAPPAPAAEQVARDEPGLVDCIEIGNFPLGQAKRIEARLDSLGLGGKLKRLDIGEPASHMVYLPSLGSKEAAERRIAELDNAGVSTHYILPDGGGNRWSISLGVFKSEPAARKLEAELIRKGFKDVRIAPRGVAADKVRFQLRALDPSAMQAIDALMADFPAQQKENCAQ